MCHGYIRHDTLTFGRWGIAAAASEIPICGTFSGVLSRRQTKAYVVIVAVVSPTTDASPFEQ